MTNELPNTCHVGDLPKPPAAAPSSCHLNNAKEHWAPAAKQPCIECPFRTSNTDKPAPHDWFTQDNFERMWAAASRENKTLPCHLFDDPEHTGYDSSSKEAGLREPVNLGKYRECAGMTAMIHREVSIAAEYPDWETYIAARPTGLQREPYETALARMAGAGVPLTEPADPDNQQLMDPAERINPDSLSWKLGDAGIKAMLAALQGVAENLHIPLPACNCRFCDGHTTVHASQEVQLSTGETVQADAELAPLLEALASAGIRTTASCQDFRGGMEQLWPEQIPVLLAEEDPRTVNYAVPLRWAGAVVRFENRTDPARAFIRTIRALEGLHLTDGTTQAQLCFPLDMVPELMKLAQAQ